MKKRNSFQRKDFSIQFDNLTMKKIIEESWMAKKNKEITKPSKSEILKQYSQQIISNNPYKKSWDDDLPDSELVIDFIDRFDASEIIKPRRYVWHLSSESDRPSIIRYGLLTNKTVFYPVFANNSDCLYWFYPFAIHNCYDQEYDAFDYWRIDTFAFHAQWRIDPNMKNDMKDELACRNWICTENDIHPSALKLYRHIYLNPNGRMLFDKNIYECLWPVHKVNELIHYISKRAA